MEVNKNPPGAQALARKLAPGALRRVGELVDSPDTDGRLLIQAAKLILWAAGDMEDDGGDGLFEIRLTGGADSDP